MVISGTHHLFPVSSPFVFEQRLIGSSALDLMNNWIVGAFKGFVEKRENRERLRLSVGTRAPVFF